MRLKERDSLLENEAGSGDVFEVRGLAVDGAEFLDEQVFLQAWLAEGVAAVEIHGADERLQTDLAHEVLVHLLGILVEMRLGGDVRLATHPARPLHTRLLIGSKSHSQTSGTYQFSKIKLMFSIVSRLKSV